MAMELANHCLLVELFMTNCIEAPLLCSHSAQRLWSLVSLDRLNTSNDFKKKKNTPC